MSDTEEAKMALDNILEYIGAEEYKGNAQLIAYIEWAISNSK